MTDPFDEARQLVARTAALVADEVTEFVRSGLRNPYPPASSAGQRPARRSGDLERSVRTTIAPTAEGVAYRIEATSAHAGYVQALGRDVLGDPNVIRELIARRMAERLASGR